MKDLVGGHVLKDEPIPAPTEGDWSWVDTIDPADGVRKQTKRRIRRDQLSAGPLAPTSDDVVNGTKRFPPDGGVGMRCLARWSWIPEDGEDGKGELTLPKGAVVGEADDINGEWFWGVYAGNKGIFQANYVWVMENVGPA